MHGHAFLERLPTHERRLDNGLTVLVREDHSAPVVAVVTHVKAGYFDEPDTLIGISHVLEHMYFKGTEQRGPGEIARETKSAGGYLNAGTIYDHTSYYTVLPSSSLEQALDIQSDALKRSAIDDDELRRELQVIIQEAKRKLDNPTAVAQETLFEAMFDVHRIRRWRIGTEALLSSFTREHVWQYYRNLYRAANTILVIAGDVDPDRAFGLAERHYGDMPSGEPVRDAGPAEPDRRGFRYHEIAGDISQVHMEWGWRTPGVLDERGAIHEDSPILDVLAVALGQGRASRLYRSVRETGAVSSISAYNYTPGDLGIFGIGAELDATDMERAAVETARSVRAMLEHGFSDAEVERARNMLESRVLRRLETAEGQANLLAEWQARGDWRLSGEYLERLLSATPARLHDVARRWLDPDALTLLLYRPGDAPSFASDTASARARVLDGVATTVPSPVPDVPPPPQRAAHVPRARRLEPQRVEDGVRFYVADAHGARIVVKPRTTSPLVTMALYCRGGSIAERTGDLGLTTLMMRTSVKGTRTRTAARLAEETEALGSSIDAAPGADLIDWSLSVPSRHLETGLDLLLDAALEPVFPDAEAERERAILLSELEHLRDDMYRYPMRLAYAAAFNGHPYGVDVERLADAVRSADLSRLADWHGARVLRAAPHVLIVGDAGDPDAVAALVAERLGELLLDPIGMNPEPPTWPDAPVSRAERRDKAQTAIAMAFPGPPRNHPDVHALQVLSAAIAGLGGRLFEELRSRRSLAYAVSAAPIARWMAGVFVAYIGTAPEREEEARTAMLDELMRTTEQPLDADEVRRAQRYLTGAWQIRQQTHSRQLADLAAAVMLGTGLAELREYEQRINAIDAGAIRAAAARWLKRDLVVEGVVRGESGGAGERGTG